MGRQVANETSDVVTACMILNFNLIATRWVVRFLAELLSHI